MTVTRQLLRTRWVTLQLTRPGPDAVMHRHHRAYAAVVLAGGYRERVWPRPAAHRLTRHSVVLRHAPWRWHIMPRHWAHQVMSARRGTVILIVAGPRHP